VGYDLGAGAAVVAVTVISFAIQSGPSLPQVIV
jgi:hypothetical protein